MLRVKAMVFSLLLLAALLISGCKQQVPSFPESSSKENSPESVRQGTQEAAASWEAKWADTLAKAKREGVIDIYASWPPETRVALGQAFKNKYGIELQFTIFGRGAEMMPKVKAEKRAGLFIADIYGGGETTLLVLLKPEEVLASMEALLFLPEALNADSWRGGKIPFTDKGKMSLGMVGVVQRTVIYHTGLVKDGEITTYRDLLKPQCKGKITLNDPTTGAGNAFMMHLGENLWGEAEAKDFLRRMIKEQDAAIQRNSRLHVDWVAQGKYAVGLAPSDIQYTFIENGAPIKHALVKEDNRLTASEGAISVAARQSHPNATIIFINWLLTKEGQEVFTRGLLPSMRLDVSTENVNPILIPKPGEKYFANSEEQIIARGKWQEIARKVVEEAIR